MAKKSRGRSQSSERAPRRGVSEKGEAPQSRKSFAAFAQRPSRRDDALRDVRRAARYDVGEGWLPKLLRPSFGMLVAALIAAGVAFVAVAYTQRDVQARPVQNEDHWHSPYGVWDCALGVGGDFLDPFQSDDDPLGIHSHRDGIIHVHPFFESSSGHGAVLKHFLDSMRVEVSTDGILLDNGDYLAAGETCDGEDSIIQVLRWEFATSSDEAPEVFTEGFNDLRFLNNGEAWVIARAPEGAEIPPPPSIPHLQFVDPNAYARLDEEGNPQDAGE